MSSLLTDTMLLYRQRICPTFDSRRNEVVHDNTLVVSLSLAYGASIQLLHIFSDRDIDAYWQRLDIARACVTFTAEVCQADLDLLSFSGWLPWISAYEVLTWELIRLTMAKDIEGAADVRADLDRMMETYMRFSKHYSFSSKNRVS